MDNRTEILMMAKEICETTDISEVAEKLSTSKWLATLACPRGDGCLWVLIRVVD